MKRIFALSTALIMVAFGANAQSEDLSMIYLPHFNYSDFRLLPIPSRQIEMKGYDYNSVLQFDEDGHLRVHGRAGNDVGWGSKEYFYWGDDGKLLSSIYEGHGSDVSYDHMVKRYEYDSQGRLSKKTIENAETLIESKGRTPMGGSVYTYEYDGDGRICKVYVKRNLKEYNWEKRTAVALPEKNIRVDVSYDKEGRVAKITEETNGKITATATYEYGEDYETPWVKCVGESMSEDMMPGTYVTTYKALGGDNCGMVGEMQVKYADPNYGESNSIFVVTDGRNESCNDELDDIYNPYLRVNEGDEPLIDFMRRFVSDKAFRAERTKGLVKKENSCTVYDLLSEYKGADPGLVITDKEAKCMFGSYPDLYMPLGEGREYGGFAYWHRWEELNGDNAILTVNKAPVGSWDYTEAHYCFVRLHGKWYLIGMTM